MLDSPPRPRPQAPDLPEMRSRFLYLSVLLLAAPLAAGPPFDFYAQGPYREGVPRPEEFLGYPPGSLHTHHHRMESYFEALAEAAPDRIQLRTYGKSYEHKRLFLAVISSPENLGRIEEIREQNLRLADPRRTTREETDAIARRAPVLVWLDYGNDGNETAAVEAAMQVAYQLVAGESEDSQRWRRRAVVLLEPDHNPESHDRHVAWYNAFGVGDPDPLAIEHHAPWGLSTNNHHYQIDLNRDAWALTQQENQALAAELLRWRPQVFVDHHGQTENYFFPPPAEPVNPGLPEAHRLWYEEFGRGNARAFDRHGWQYYVRDVFDLFYPGYWDTWPVLHGAIGMTYETDGGGSRGLAWRREDGSVVTFREGIARHFVASLATVRTAVSNREALLWDFYGFFTTALEEGRRGEPARAYALAAEPDPRRSAALVAALLRHGLEVRRAAEPFMADAMRLPDGATGRQAFTAGTYLVDLAQPDKRMADAVLGPEAAMTAEFLERQYARWSRNARRGRGVEPESYEFYDLTAWSLPPAYGVEAWALAELPAVAAEPVTATRELAGSGDWAEELPFDPPAVAGGVTGRIASLDGRPLPTAGEPTQARSAYLFRPETEGAMRLAAALLREDYTLAVSLSPLESGAEEFPRGTFVLLADRNPARLHRRLHELAADAGVAVVATDTAFASKGDTGVGSNTVRGLEAPRVAMIADEGVRITAYGAAWFTLERRLGYPFTPIRFRELLDGGLDDLDVLVVPEGSARQYRRALGEEGFEALGGWIERGGTLVGWGPGALDLAADAGWTTAPLAGRPGADAEEAEDASPPAEEVAAELARIDALAPGAPRPPLPSPTARPDRPQPVPGAVLRTRLDPSSWLTLGLPGTELPVLVRGSRVLGLAEEGDSPVVFAEAERLRMAGFLWPETSARWLAGSAYCVIDPRKRGQVILFAHDPNFRLVWRSTSRLFANALLLGPTLGTEQGPERY